MKGTTVIHLFVRSFFASPPFRSADERGQATAEYALVLLGAAAIAVLVVGWATKTDLVGDLLDAVFGRLVDQAK